MVVAAHSCTNFSGKLLLWSYRMECWSSFCMSNSVFFSSSSSLFFYMYFRCFTRFIGSMWMRGNISLHQNVSFVFFCNDFFPSNILHKIKMTVLLPWLQLLINAKCLFPFGLLPVGYETNSEKKRLENLFVLEMFEIDELLLFAKAFVNRKKRTIEINEQRA